MIAGAAISSSRAKKQAAAQSSAPQPAAPVATSVGNSTDEMIAQLEKLGALKDKGILTQEEFDTKKKQILDAAA